MIIITIMMKCCGFSDDNEEGNAACFLGASFGESPFLQRRGDEIFANIQILFSMDGSRDFCSGNVFGASTLEFVVVLHSWNTIFAISGLRNLDF